MMIAYLQPLLSLLSPLSLPPLLFPLSHSRLSSAPSQLDDGADPAVLVCTLARHAPAIREGCMHLGGTVPSHQATSGGSGSGERSRGGTRGDGNERGGDAVGDEETSGPSHDGTPPPPALLPPPPPLPCPSPLLAEHGVTLLQRVLEEQARHAAARDCNAAALCWALATLRDESGESGTGGGAG